MSSDNIDDRLLGRIIQIGNELESQKFVLNIDIDRSRWFSKVINIPLQIILALVGTGSSLNTSINYAKMTWQEFILNILVMIGTVLNGINTSLNFKYKINDLQTIFFKINDSSNKIQNFLLKYNHVDIKETEFFLEHITKEYEHILENCPEISAHAKKELEKELKENNQQTPYDLKLLVVPKMKGIRRNNVIIQTPKRPRIIINTSSEGGSDRSEDIFEKS